MAGIFDIPGAHSPGGSVGRALHNLDMQQPAVQRLVEAARLLKKPYQAPGYCGKAVAHLVIPALKVAVLVVGPTQSKHCAAVVERRAKWREMGYEAYAVKTADILNTLPRVVADMLLTAVTKG